jgi:hypothetical protein
MLLREALDSLNAARPISPGTLANYRRACRYFSDYVGFDAKVSDLTTRRVNEWLLSCESNYDPTYVRSLRRDLLVVWNHAADCEECVHPKSRLIRIPKTDKRNPTAWPSNWIPRLLEASSKIDGLIKRYRVERSWYAEAYLRTQLELLCRPSDMRYLKWIQLQPDGLVEFAQHKTGHVVRCRLTRETLRKVNRLRGLDQNSIFPLSKSATEIMIQRLFEIAGIEKPEGESLGHLRHTGGTQIASTQGNDKARQALGHTPDSRVFEKHYLDSSKLPIIEGQSWWTSGDNPGSSS